MIPHLFLWHGPFKGLCKKFKNLQLPPGVMSDSPGYDTLGRFLRKIQITQKNHNQNQKYFYPLLSGPGSLELWKNQVQNLVGQSI